MTSSDGLDDGAWLLGVSVGGSVAFSGMLKYVGVAVSKVALSVGAVVVYVALSVDNRVGATLSTEGKDAPEGLGVSNVGSVVPPPALLVGSKVGSTGSALGETEGGAVELKIAVGEG